MSARRVAHAGGRTVSRPQEHPDAPWHYEVIGEHLTDPTRLLVIGDDGHFYALDLHDGQVAPTTFSDNWLIDTCDLRDKLQRLNPA
jgi:hypothetical protein